MKRFYLLIILILIAPSVYASEFFEDMDIQKATPTLTLTDTGDSNSATISRTDTNGELTIKNKAFKPGSLGNALAFDGIDDYVACGTDSSLDLGSGDGTFGMWIKTTETGVANSILMKGAGGAGQKRYSFFTLPGNFAQVQIDDNTSIKKVDGSDVTITDGTWHLIVGVRDGNNLRLYVDGSEDSASPTDITGYGDIDDTEPLTIAAQNLTGSQGDSAFFEGDVDDVAVWPGRVLSDNDISDWWNSGSGLRIDKDTNFPTDASSMGTNLAVLLHFDETEMDSAPGGTDAEDSSINTNHGTAEASMGDEDFVTGKLQRVGADAVFTFIISEDGTDPGEEGINTFGDLDGRTVIAGKTIRLDINSTEIGQIDANGTLTIDNGNDYPSQIDIASAAQTANIYETKDSAGNVQHSLGPDGGVVFNEEGNDVDTRIEGDTEENLFRVDAGTDTVRMGDWDTNYMACDNTGDCWYVGATSGMPYGEISATSIGTETTISSAGVAVQVVIFDTDVHSNMTLPDHTNDHITITKAGHYFIAISATVNSIAGASSKFEMSCKKNNGASDIIPHMDRNIAGGGGQAGVVSLSGIADLAANDTVEIWIENETNTQNYVVEDISLAVMQLGGT
jgi:hypothetical protein